jgi:arylsulfatase A-like enzyme
MVLFRYFKYNLIERGGMKNTTKYNIFLMVFIFMLLALIGATPSFSQNVPFIEKSGEAGNQPNIILMIYDSRRLSDFSFGAKGNKHNDTPFLNQFKDDAVFFNYAVSTGTWTVPVHSTLFTGYSVFDLRNDTFQKNIPILPPEFPTVAELLSKEGYLTIAYPDHPYFYSGNPTISLVKGFQYFNIITDFFNYTSITNIGTSKNSIVRERRLPRKKGIKFETLRKRIQLFNENKSPVDVNNVADYDKKTGTYLPNLQKLFKNSDYFYNRFSKEFDKYFLEKVSAGMPYFLFINNHMVARGKPDIDLLQEWQLQLLMANAQKRKKSLIPIEEGEDFKNFFLKNISNLSLTLTHSGSSGLRKVYAFIQCFDNRFFDAYFEFMMDYLNQHGLLRNTYVIVTSDHGLSFGEKGEEPELHQGARPYEYITRVPLIIKTPQDSMYYRHHGVYHENVSILDIFHTILDVSGLEKKYHSIVPDRGKSIFKRIEGNKFDEIIFAEASTRPSSYHYKKGIFGEMVAMYYKDYKFIYAPRTFEVVARNIPRPLNYAYNLYDTIADIINIGLNVSKLDYLIPHVPYFDKKEVVEKGDDFALLYDLDNDPYEQNNILEDNKELKNFFMKKYARRYRSYKCGLAYSIKNNGKIEMKEEKQDKNKLKAHFDKDAVKTLKALGYIQ